MVDLDQLFSSKRRDRHIQKVDVDECVSVVARHCNMSDDEFKYYMMKILVSDSSLASEFNDLLVTAKLLYNDEAREYTNMIAKMEESFRQQDELLERMKFEELLLRSQHSLKAQVIDKSILQQIKV